MIGVLDGVQICHGKGSYGFFLAYSFALHFGVHRNYIELVREKLTIFPLEQYTTLIAD